MSDDLIVTLGLLAAVVACLAKPCTPTHWSRVKVSRRALDALPEPAREPVARSPEASESGFADGLTTPA